MIPARSTGLRCGLLLAGYALAGGAIAPSSARSNERTAEMPRPAPVTASLPASDRGAATTVPRCWDGSREPRLLATGLRVPLQLGMGPRGELYAGSGQQVGPGAAGEDGERIPFFRVERSGAVKALGRVLDPDSLAVGPDGKVYTGAFGGRIFVHEIRADGGVETSLFVADSRLGNVDGLTWSGGDLYSVAYDHATVYRVRGSSRVVERFADLESIGFTKLTGIAFDPWTASCFVGAPVEGRLARLDARSGEVQDPAFSIGFTFVGHLAFDPTGASGSDLFAADNGAGCVWRIERATGARRPFVSGLLPRMGGLSFRADGTLCASRITDDGEVGEIWEIAPRPALAAAAREFPRVDARAQSPAEPRVDGGSAGPRQVPDSARPVLTQPASSVSALRSGEGLFRRQRTVPRERRSSGMPNLAWDDLVFLVDLESPVRTRGRRGVVLPLLPSA